MRMFDYTVSVRMLLKLARMSSVHVVLLPFFKNFWQLKVVHVAPYNRYKVMAVVKGVLDRMGGKEGCGLVLCTCLDL